MKEQLVEQADQCLARRDLHLVRLEGQVYCSLISTPAHQSAYQRDSALPVLGLEEREVHVVEACPFAVEASVQTQLARQHWPLAAAVFEKVEMLRKGVEDLEFEN